MTPEQLGEIEQRADAATVGGAGSLVRALYSVQDVPALIAEVKRLSAERDRFRGLTERAYNLRMHGEHAPGSTDTWQRWDRDAETALRAAMEQEGGW